MLNITDEEIDKIVNEYGETKTNKEWSNIISPPEGFANGMKFMRDLINQGKVKNDTN